MSITVPHHIQIFCEQCERRMTRIELINAFGEKWICPVHGQQHSAFMRRFH